MMAKVSYSDKSDRSSEMLKCILRCFLEKDGKKQSKVDNICVYLVHEKGGELWEIAMKSSMIVKDPLDVQAGFKYTVFVEICAVVGLVVGIGVWTNISKA